MKYLVTGGAGFIGSNLALTLESEKHQVTVIDNFSSGHLDNLKGFKGKIIKQDISKNFEINETFNAIFHQAAITDPRYGNDEDLLKQNINGFKNIIEIAENGKSKLIYASSASVYGNTATPQKEKQEKDITCAYAQSKLIMDEMASHYFEKMHVVGLRYFNVFGPNEANKGRAASMIYHLIKQLQSNQIPKLFKFGEQKRDHIYVKDCVLANILALDAKPGIYNVGTGIATTFNDLLKLINESLGTNYTPNYIDMPYNPKTYQTNTQADTKKAESILKFKARYPLKDAIKEYSGMI